MLNASREFKKLETASLDSIEYFCPETSERERRKMLKMLQRVASESRPAENSDDGETKQERASAHKEGEADAEEDVEALLLEAESPTKRAKSGGTAKPKKAARRESSSSKSNKSSHQEAGKERAGGPKRKKSIGGKGAKERRQSKTSAMRSKNENENDVANEDEDDLQLDFDIESSDDDGDEGEGDDGDAVDVARRTGKGKEREKSLRASQQGQRSARYAVRDASNPETVLVKTGELDKRLRNRTCEMVVEDVLDVRVSDEGMHLFLVKWLGLPESYNTWEPRAHIFNQTLLHELARSRLDAS